MTFDAPSRVVIGCMTGTSLDGLDAAAVRVGLAAEGDAGRVRAEFLEGFSAPLGEAAPALRALASGERLSAQAIAETALAFGRLHARVAGELASRQGADLIAVHGQTVYHGPPASWQLMNPWPIAEALRAPVVTDLRGADLAAGGEGAPITPMADWVMLRSATETRCVVNLGGFCNITVLPAGGGPGSVSARDVCACNQVLDAVARAGLGATFDRDGAAAMAGSADAGFVEWFGEALGRQASAGRSLGTGDELDAMAREMAASASAECVAASACVAIAGVIAAAVPADADRVLVAGGGVHNARLMAELTAASGAAVASTDTAGLPAAYREAAAMAVLGSLARDCAAITLQPVTRHGHRPVRAGLWIEP
ncbi:MAG: anhydro-N-acetylmuramic acid kinase [Planctomycetota bacterium]